MAEIEIVLRQGWLWGSFPSALIEEITSYFSSTNIPWIENQQATRFIITGSIPALDESSISDSSCSSWQYRSSALVSNLFWYKDQRLHIQSQKANKKAPF